MFKNIGLCLGLLMSLSTISYANILKDGQTVRMSDPHDLELTNHTLQGSVDNLIVQGDDRSEVCQEHRPLCQHPFHQQELRDISVLFKELSEDHYPTGYINVDISQIDKYHQQGWYMSNSPYCVKEDDTHPFVCTQEMVKFK